MLVGEVTSKNNLHGGEGDYLKNVEPSGEVASVGF